MAHSQRSWAAEVGLRRPRRKSRTSLLNQAIPVHALVRQEMRCHHQIRREVRKEEVHHQPNRKDSQPHHHPMQQRFCGQGFPFMGRVGRHHRVFRLAPGARRLLHHLKARLLHFQLHLNLRRHLQIPMAGMNRHLHRHLSRHDTVGANGHESSLVSAPVRDQ